MNVTHHGITAMTPKKFKVIEGGRNSLEHNLVIALFEGNIAEVDKLSSQLKAIAKKPSPPLKILPNKQVINNSLNQG